jgi:hypothetical protein
VKLIEKKKILGLDLIELGLPVTRFDEQLLFPACINSVADPDGSGAFLTPGSRIRDG